MRGPVSRRLFGVLALGGAVQGCGLHPVYAPTAAGDGAAEGLAATEVMPIPERLGQLLREALRIRFDSGGAAVSRRYDLLVSLSLSGEGIGIQRDSTSSRVRLVGSATWILYAQSPQRAVVTNGYARTVDGYNGSNQQSFASDLESEAVQRRMMDALADKVTLQLGTWFNQRAAG